MEEAASSSVLYECPVCFEIPLGEIFQCKNGHPICDNCSKGVAQCPQCREGLGVDKIRCRVMEAFVAEMEIGCSNKGEGCKVRLARKDLAAHLEKDCNFRSISLCKFLGLSNCNFLSRRGPQDAIHRHFVEAHGFKLFVSRHDDNKLATNLQEFARIRLSLSLRHMKTSKENCFTYMFPDLTVGMENFKFVIAFHTNIALGNYSVICLNLADNSPGAGVAVEISATDKGISWIWKGTPIHFLEAEKAIRNPPLQISIPYLLDVLGDGENLECIVSYF